MFHLFSPFLIYSIIKRAVHFSNAYCVFVYTCMHGSVLNMDILPYFIVRYKRSERERKTYGIVGNMLLR